MNRKYKYILGILFAGILLLSYGCSHSKKTVNGDGIDRNYDNSEYVLRTQEITIEGVGVSLDYNTAQYKALTDAKKKLVDTLISLVKSISARRGFDSSMPNEFYVSALRSVRYFDDNTYNDKGELMYRSTCTAKVRVLPMLNSLYQEKHYVSEYGYYQFLRDIDQILTNH